MSIRHEHRRYDDHGDHGERGGVAPGKRTPVQRLPGGAPRPTAAEDTDASAGNEAEDGAAGEAPRGAGMDPDELSRLMDESLGFFGDQPVQRKAAAGETARPVRASGPTSIISISGGNPCTVLIGKGAAHGTQVGQHVRIDTVHGVPIVGEVVTVFPTRSRVKLGVPNRSVAGYRKAHFTSGGPVTSYASFLAALRAKRAANKAAHEARRKAAEEANVELRVTDTGHLFGGRERAEVTVTVAYALDGEDHDLTAILPIQNWRGRALAQVRASLDDAGLDNPPSRVVSTLMNAIVREMAKVKRDE